MKTKRPTRKHSKTELRTTLGLPANARSELYCDKGSKQLWAPDAWMIVMHELTASNAPKTKVECVQLVNGSGRLQADISVSMVDKALQKHQGIEWFEPWLMRGQETPATVATLTMSQLGDCAKALDYGQILESQPRIRQSERGSRQPLNITYNELFKHRQLPFSTFDELVEWVLYLFSGVVPRGWFEIVEDLERLRRATSLAGRIERSGISTSTPGRWNSDEDRAALEAAIEWAREGRQGELPALEKHPAWRKLFQEPWYYRNPAELPRGGTFRAAQEKKKKSMLDYADTFNLKDTLAALNRNEIWLNDQRKKSRRVNGENRPGPDEALQRFLRSEIPAWPHHELRGRIGETRLFWPSQFVRNFQTAAQKMWRLLVDEGITKLPCFKLLLLDRVLPRPVGSLQRDRALLYKAWRRPVASPNPTARSRYRGGKKQRSDIAARNSSLVADRAAGMSWAALCERYLVNESNAKKIVRTAGRLNDSAGATKDSDSKGAGVQTSDAVKAQKPKTRSAQELSEELSDLLRTAARRNGERPGPKRKYPHLESFWEGGIAKKIPVSERFVLWNAKNAKQFRDAEQMENQYKAYKNRPLAPKKG